MESSVALSRLASRYGFRGKRTRTTPSSQGEPAISRAVRARRVTSAVTANRRISRLARVLDSLVEHKKLDTPIAPAFVGGVSTSGTLAELSLVAQGDTENDRTGVKITPTKLDLDIGITDDSTGPCYWRAILFRWNDTTLPNVTDIINPASTDSPLNWVNKGKYSVLHDKHYYAQATSTGSIIQIRRSFRFGATDFIRFTGSSATSGELGRIFLLLISNSAAIPHPLAFGYSRLQYMDV